MMKKKLQHLWKRRKKEQKEEEERKNKRREEEGRGGKRGGNFFEISAKKGGPMKRKINNPPQCLVWFRLNGLGSSKTAKTVSSTTGALVGAGSLRLTFGASKPVGKYRTNLLFRVHQFKSRNVRETPHKPTLKFVLNFVRWSSLSPYILCIYYLFIYL
jgi:hypothetical protein